MSATSPTVNTVLPGRSMRREPDGRNPCTPMSVMMIAVAPTGRLAKKISRHDTSVSRPPSTGAQPRPAVMTAPQMPSTAANCRQ